MGLRMHAILLALKAYGCFWLCHRWDSESNMILDPLVYRAQNLSKHIEQESLLVQAAVLSLLPGTPLLWACGTPGDYCTPASRSAALHCIISSFCLQTYVLRSALPPDWQRATALHLPSLNANRTRLQACEKQCAGDNVNKKDGAVNTAALKDGVLTLSAGEWKNGFLAKDKALIYRFKMQKVMRRYANVAIKRLLIF